MIKLYFPNNLYNPKKRGHLFPLLKPFIKGENFSDSARLKMYQVSEKDFGLVTNIKDADFVILPMSWNYYVKNKQVKEVRLFIKKATQYQKKVWSFCNGDFGVRVPDIKNMVVFRQSGERSKLPEFHIGMPLFIDDPFKKHFKTETLPLNSYNSKPKIGFCGQTNASVLNSIIEISRTALRNLKYYAKISIDLPQKIQSTSRLRSTILQKIKISALLDPHFIERKKYRAGAVTPKQRQKTTQEFYTNIKETDYTVCMRGVGNFSVRFYETLAMGRIPIFINTDCILPLADTINWKKHVVWVEENELDNLEEIVVNFHKKLSPEELKNKQIANRKLWEEKLTLGGFFKQHET